MQGLAAGSVDGVGWTLLLPLKGLPAAKSRLRAVADRAEGTDEAGHAALVKAMRADVLAAARATPQVARIVVIADHGADHGADYACDVTLRQRRRGLNGALRDGADYAAKHWPTDGVAALVGDVPALRPEELGAALDAAARHPRAYVRDADGTGTTLLTAAPGHPLRPEFGTGSAARHAKTAVAVDGEPGLRQDVDTAADLRAAFELGVGPATRGAHDVVPRSR